MTNTIAGRGTSSLPETTQVRLTVAWHPVKKPTIFVHRRFDPAVDDVFTDENEAQLPALCERLGSMLEENGLDTEVEREVRHEI